ncbi:hypothetical protein POM88_036793 [Heracleum sosnowskyi]|uniref:Desiccation-related protein PCC13-62 n=1 Tax=Heracleum sosnowskyi TaxID=360622 RepID=A0AAD8HP41_9APIA|nr:hypothetical protein POM88_036793 [Heracleum sosnowskyi]
MAISIISSSSVIVLVVTILCSEVLCKPYPKCDPDYPDYGLPIYKRDVELLQFAENLEHLEADYFLFAAYGYGLDIFAPELVGGGPPPIGARRANLDNQTRNITGEFGLQEIGHLRALKSTVGGFPRPLLDLSESNFAKIMNSAIGYKLDPPFNP